MRSPEKKSKAKREHFRRIAAHIRDYAAVLASLGRALDRIVSGEETVDERTFEELRRLHRRMGRARLTSEGVEELSQIGSRLQKIQDDMD